MTHAAVMKYPTLFVSLWSENNVLAHQGKFQDGLDYVSWMQEGKKWLALFCPQFKNKPYIFKFTNKYENYSVHARCPFTAAVYPAGLLLLLSACPVEKKNGLAARSIIIRSCPQRKQRSRFLQM